MSPRHRGWVILTIGIAGFVGVGVALQLGAVLGGTEAPSLSPLGGLVEVVFGRVKAATATWVLLGLVGVAIVYAVARFVPAKSARAGGEAEANDRIGRASAFTSARESSRMKETREVLHPDAEKIGPGLPLACQGNRIIYQGWRQCALHIWSPGRGKTTSQVIPHAIAAPGAFVMTTNKVDGVWEVIAARSTRGRIWICDPNDVLHRKRTADTRFPMIEMVTDSTSAEKVGLIFEKATHGLGGDTGNVNAHFDREGGKTLGRLMLAANLAGYGDAEIFRWVTETREEEAAKILEANGLPRQAQALRGLAKQPGDTRGSVWATAQRCASPFEHEGVLNTFRIQGIGSERVFNAARFIQSQDTLILIGDLLEGGTSAFVSALVWEIFTKAREQAAQNGGRLRTPLVMDLDEVGNAVMLPELADWYSFAGSSGIVISSYLQSRAQGQDQFGEKGFEKLQGASNVFVYGGGSQDTKFLKDIAELIGRYDHRTESSSSSYSDGTGPSRSSSDQVQQREIMSVAQLSRMSKGTIYLSADDGAGLVSARYWFTDKVLRTQLGPAKQWLIDHESRLNEAQINEMQQDIEQEMQAHE
jgi:type IV secretory pathway TraG/TraD family ATPase VirD4